jgi:hypothetical protein
MVTWTSRIVVLATLAAGCTGAIGSDDGSSGSGAGAASGAGAGSGAGTGGGAGAAVDPTVCVPGIPQTSQLPRLTREQYDNTISDLMGLGGNPSSMLAPDAQGSVDRRAWDGYQAAAEALSAQVMANADVRARVIPCAVDDAACARQFIEQFGMRVFRRPLTPEEVTRFENLYTNRAQITATGSFDEAAELIIRAFLMSPSFLTRAEIAEQPDGDRLALSGYEVASRLSYMLWNSMPDDALFNAAAAGTLSTREGVLAEAQRMIGDVRTRARVGAFHRQWAGMNDGALWTEVDRATNLYPAFNQAQIPAMTRETELFFEHLVFDQGGSFQDLLTQPVAFVNSDLAPLYGLDPSQYGADFQRVDLDPATRAGVFTRIGFLMSHGLYDRTSPILRGAFIQKKILCTPIGAPPPEAESTPLPTTADLTTNRQRVDAQTSGSTCAGCHHSLINPTGFAMEAYDAIGAHQVTEPGSGAPIDTAAAVLIGDATVNVQGPVDLFQAIAGSAEAQLCYARHWVQAAYERSLTNEDSCTAESLASKLTEDGYTVLNLVADLTQADSFRYRAIPSEVAP